MPLQQLIPSGGTVAIQDTTLALDAVSRHVCNTWPEATANGGPPFGAIVVGAGMYGGAVATDLYRLTGRRILVLDAGPFLVAEHVQNMVQIGFNVPGAIPPAADPGVARELVWGMPWRGNNDFPGLAYCAGGKSLFWGGWCPRLTSADLSNWPAATAGYLNANYGVLEDETGASVTADFISGPLFLALRSAFEAATPGVPNVELGLGTNGVTDAPLAVQGEPPASGLFSFDKYSVMPALIGAIREDAANSGGNDANRRLFLVPRAHVVRFHEAGGVVHTLEVDANGGRQFLSIQPDAALVLSASAIETTRMALHSSPTPLMGRNLQAHIRSDFTVRIRRAAFPGLPTDVEIAALLIRGLAPTGRFHLQITASAHSGGSDALLFHMIPDIDLLDEQLMNDDPNWITITVRGIGEMHGDRTTPLPNGTGSWINLSPFEVDEYGVPRAFVHLALSGNDPATWQTMDQVAVDLVQSIAGTPGNIEYMYDGAFQAAPFPLDRPFPEWHRGLGTTYHEAGTLWMGDDPATSVTDPVGRFHHLANAYACDQSIFPTVGSVNPALTGLTLARSLAEALA
jgi:choline dehydrogenase-like flavoprotein